MINWMNTCLYSSHEGFCPCIIHNKYITDVNHTISLSICVTNRCIPCVEAWGCAPVPQRSPSKERSQLRASCCQPLQILLSCWVKVTLFLRWASQWSSKSVEQHLSHLHPNVILYRGNLCSGAPLGKQGLSDLYCCIMAPWTDPASALLLSGVTPKGTYCTPNSVSTSASWSQTPTAVVEYKVHLALSLFILISNFSLEM